MIWVVGVIEESLPLSYHYSVGFDGWGFNRNTSNNKSLLRDVERGDWWASIVGWGFTRVEMND